MGLFSKKKETVAVEQPPCLHVVLMPRWDSVADMGKEELATRFVCEACHQEFTPDQARELRSESVAGRLVHQDAADENRWAAPTTSSSE